MARPKHLIEYGIYRSLLMLVRLLPYGAMRPMGRQIGNLMHRLDHRHRWVALNNLQLALPDVAPEERARLAKRCFQHFGEMVLDNLALPRFDAVALCRLLTLEDWENLDRAEAAGRGVLIISAHFGNWEVLAHPMAIYRGGMHMVARTPDNPLLADDLRRMRERFGNRVIPKRRSGRRILQALREGGKVVIVMDQRVHPNEGIEVPFFGHGAITTPLPAKLSLRTGAPAVPMFAYPRAGGGFRVVARPPIEPEGSGPEAIAALTARYNAAIEAEVRRDPEMWLWMHERWIWLEGHPRWRETRSHSIP